jgi:hypothetical protein
MYYKFFAVYLQAKNFKQMKRLVLCMALLLPAIGLLAQDKDIVDVIAQETCDCVSKKNLESLDQDQINMELGFCIMESLGKHKGEYEDKINVDLNDPSSFQKLGEQIGFKMAAICPQTLMKVATVQQGAAAAPAPGASQPVSELAGTMKGLQGDDFQYVVVTEDSGREHKFLWLRYFKGSEKLIEDPKSLMGKKVKVTFATIESYSAKLKDYTNRKEIKGLEVMN